MTEHLMGRDLEASYRSAWAAYAAERAAHEAAHPFDFGAPMEEWTFREPTVDEQVGQLLTEHGLVGALAHMVRLAVGRYYAADEERLAIRILWCVEGNGNE